MTNNGPKFHFYAWRGGPKFWASTQRYPDDPAFFAALAEAVKLPQVKQSYMTATMVDDFLSSPHMPRGARSQADYRLWGLRFAEAFKDDPAKMFEEPEARAEVNEWRKAWAHSPRQYDYSGTVVTRILNWAWKEAGKLRVHYCGGFSKVYEVDRSLIVWTTAFIETVIAKAPDWVCRLLVAACETGLPVGDLIRLSRAHIEDTQKGRRIVIRTNKRNQMAIIPVTQAMAEVIDATPEGRDLILTNTNGKPLTEHRASEGLRQWRDKAGLTPAALGYDLRLQDARGTAATRLLNLDMSLRQIATIMGWSLKHASAVIEHYAMVSPAETDEVLEKLDAAKKAAKKDEM
ncbi:tyrosine-type recombinase/integrase [Rhodobacter sp. 24-YEA-8]|uniref:tyrosine-type recombinase/integrase n=1 Tax=Rhodobacter sp. 24-YEA-8 TaxID=1884310 RepID=UPI00209BB718|nr:tyrosine-type recombinase/integrase [Rhodobacter sp. 24-YEA-8]